MKPMKNKSFVSRVVLLIVGIALLIEIPICIRHVIPRPTNADVTVYVTSTGECYHSSGCRYLSKSKHPRSLYQADKEYRRCSVCNPPVLSSIKRSPDVSECITSAAIPLFTVLIPLVVFGLCKASERRFKEDDKKRQDESLKAENYYENISYDDLFK